MKSLVGTADFAASGHSTSFLGPLNVAGRTPFQKVNLAREPGVQAKHSSSKRRARQVIFGFGAPE